MKKTVKSKLVISLIFLVSVFIYRKTAPNWIQAFGVDSITYLFLIMLPIIWILETSLKIINFFLLLFFSLTVIFSIFGKNIYAENSAIFTYLFLCLVLVIKIFNFNKHEA